jgi:hypothetical protein
MISPASLAPAAPTTAAPHDPVFEAWAADGLVWLPEHGMGRLRVTEAPYDSAYFEKYQAYAATEMGRKITAARVDLVRRHTDRHVVDVGIGCGAFISARMGWTWGYDVNPAGIAWLHSVGRWCDPYAAPVEAASLWDTLEHIPDPGALLRNVREHVFVSLPIVPGDGPPPLDWKHLRPDEHVWYWTRAGFVAWMGAHGFELVEANEDEVRLGRSDIGTFCFRRAP